MIAVNTVEFMQYVMSCTNSKAVKLECPSCHKEFVRPKNVIVSKFGRHNKQTFIYCSHICSTNKKRAFYQVTCLHCKVAFFKILNQINKTPNHFCSKSCAATYNNAHKTSGNRRSKLEIWIQNHLTILYPTLDIKYNSKQSINSELDLFIPSLNLAFELNGIHHYEPIYGLSKLERIQNNEKKKIQACTEKKIKLIIINTSGQKVFKEETSIRFLTVIRDHIERCAGFDPAT